MEHKYILSLDQGITSSRAALFYSNGELAYSAEKAFKQYAPHPGWVEQNPAEIWSSQYAVLSEVMAKANTKADYISAIGIANQRDTVIVWDKIRDLPVYPVIGSQDRRTADYCAHLVAQGLEPMIRERTGLFIDPCFCATKVKWILDNVPGARGQADQGELAIFTIDSFLIWKLTDGKLHITDTSNASRTMLFNIYGGQWDTELLHIFGIPTSMLPDVRSSSEEYGVSTIMSPGGSGIPIAAIAANQQAALFGQRCIEKGMVNNTYGNGCTLLMLTGEKPILANIRMNAMIAWTKDGKTEYAMEGTISGAIIDWLRDRLAIFEKLEDLQEVANTEYAEDIFIVPALTGLGIPYLKSHVRGMIVGISPDTTKSHIALAVLKSITYETYDMLKAMESASGVKLKELRVDGPASFNGLLMQLQCNILGVYVVKPHLAETSALGAAYLAGLAVGFWSPEDIALHWRRDRNFRPHISQEQAQMEIERWHKAVEAAIAWSSNH